MGMIELKINVPELFDQSIFAVRVYDRASRTDRRLMASRGGFITTAGGSYLEERSGMDTS
jgi:hypothetical protein